MRKRLRRAALLSPALLVAASTVVVQPPVRAIEEVLVELPLLENVLTVKLDELSSTEALMAGTSDLADLDRASGGELGRRLLKLLNQPVPMGFRQIAESSVGSGLLEQALLLVSSFGTIEGQSTDLSGETLKAAMVAATATSPNGVPSLLQFMRAIPGQRVRLNLARTQVILDRMLGHRRRAERLMAAASVVPVAPAPDDGPVATSTTTLRVAHRSQPLDLLVIQPQGPGNGRLVMISHGLWDAPRNFEGWARVLAAQGYTVVLPRHPGSDKQQQHEVLSGQAPPPTPAELGLRARDLRAVVDAVAVGSIPGVTGLNTSGVVVIGHSWGATTALQLAGVKPQDTSLLARCGDLDDPERNLSWALQCSWVSGVEQAGIVDTRVVAVAAVSPPVSLLFGRGSGTDISARILLVSGTDDWVVPPDPEAVAPFAKATPRGHQLVLVRGGDHFNLRPLQAANGGVLSSLLLEWTNRAFLAGAKVRPVDGASPLVPVGAWGSSDKPMADVTAAVQGKGS